MEKPEPKLGRLAYTDRRQRRQTRSLPLNDYEYEALKSLAGQAGLSTGDFITKRLRLPSNEADAKSFARKLAKGQPASTPPQA